MKEEPCVEVQFSEQPYQPRQVDAVESKSLSFESQVVISTLIAVNAALFLFLVFFIG